MMCWDMLMLCSSSKTLSALHWGGRDIVWWVIAPEDYYPQSMLVIMVEKSYWKESAHSHRHSDPCVKGQHLQQHDSWPPLKSALDWKQPQAVEGVGTGGGRGENLFADRDVGLGGGRGSPLGDERRRLDCGLYVDWAGVQWPAEELAPANGDGSGFSGSESDSAKPGGLLK